MFCISCADESQVGYELIGDGELDVLFRDDIEIQTRTLRVDSIPGFASINFLGSLKDPALGSLRSEVYMSLGELRALPSYQGTFDSIILVMPINIALSFGNDQEVHNLAVHELSEILPNTVYSNQSFLSGSEIGSLEGYKMGDTTIVLLPDSTELGDNMIVIPLSQDVGINLFNDTISHQNLNDLRNLFAGVKVTSDSDQSILALNSGATLSNGSTIRLYYTDVAGNYESFNYHFTTILTNNSFAPHQFSNYQRDYEESQVQEVFGIPTPPEEFCYVQGLSGPNVEIDLSAIQEFQDAIINHVSLEIVAADIIGRDTSFFPVAESLRLYKLENGLFTDLFDNTFFVGNTNGILTRDQVRNVNIYEMDITSHCIGILNENEPEVLYLRVIDEIRNPSSAILHGPNHPEFPMKLKVTYTEL